MPKLYDNGLAGGGIRHRKSRRRDERISETVERGHESEEVRIVRVEALHLWGGDQEAADRFLSRPNQLLDGRQPLAVAQESVAGAKRVVKLIGAARAGVAV